jgi:formate hydrogenlyase transcriptional activator
MAPAESEVIPIGGFKMLCVATRGRATSRELQNLIERAVILSSGSRLANPLAHAHPPACLDAGTSHASTLEVIERAHIARVLEETNWVVGGRGGAAVRLGIKRTTLQAMMKRFAIGRTGAGYYRICVKSEPAASPSENLPHRLKVGPGPPSLTQS